MAPSRGKHALRKTFTAVIKGVIQKILNAKIFLRKD